MRPSRLLPLLGLLFAGCNGEKEGPEGIEDPLARYPGACALWAEKACSADVQGSCGTGETGCRRRQAEYCEALFARVGVEEPMDPETVTACADQVEIAYEDARLDLEEYKLVRYLEGDGACGELAATADGAGGTGAGEPIEPGFRCLDMPADSCVPGFYCNGSYCVQRALPDEVCCEEDEDPVTEPVCEAEVLCVESTVCIAGETGSTCVARGTLPECGRDQECADDEVCIVHALGGDCVSIVNLVPDRSPCDSL